MLLLILVQHFIIQIIQSEWMMGCIDIEIIRGNHGKSCSSSIITFDHHLLPTPDQCPIQSENYHHELSMFFLPCNPGLWLKSPMFWISLIPMLLWLIMIIFVGIGFNRIKKGSGGGACFISDDPTYGVSHSPAVNSDQNHSEMSLIRIDEDCSQSLSESNSHGDNPPDYSSEYGDRVPLVRRSSADEETSSEHSPEKKFMLRFSIIVCVLTFEGLFRWLPFELIGQKLQLQSPFTLISILNELLFVYALYKIMYTILKRIIV